MQLQRLMKTNYLLLLLLTFGIAVNSSAATTKFPLTVTVEGDGTLKVRSLWTGAWPVKGGILP